MLCKTLVSRTLAVMISTNYLWCHSFLYQSHMQYHSISLAHLLKWGFCPQSALSDGISNVSDGQNSLSGGKGRLSGGWGHHHHPPPPHQCGQNPVKCIQFCKSDLLGVIPMYSQNDRFYFNLVYVTLKFCGVLTSRWLKSNLPVIPQHCWHREQLICSLIG